MKQSLLFDNGTVAATPSLARRSDPETSKTAAADIVANLGTYHRRVYDVLIEIGPDRTAQEIAVACVARHGGLTETYRKRPHELTTEQYGELFEELPERRCVVTGKMATTFSVRSK